MIDGSGKEAQISIAQRRGGLIWSVMLDNDSKDKVLCVYVCVCRALSTQRHIYSVCPPDNSHSSRHTVLLELWAEWLNKMSWTCVWGALWRVFEPLTHTCALSQVIKGILRGRHLYVTTYDTSVRLWKSLSDQTADVFCKWLWNNASLL